MKFYASLKLAFRALLRNPARALLTTLGIVIGIAAVIAMVAIGSGSSNSIRRSIESMGANNILIIPGSASSGGVRFGSGSGVSLTPQDYQAIVREIPTVLDACPMVGVRSQVIAGNKNWTPDTIHGSTPSYLTVRNWEIAEGEVFNENHIRSAERVCVVGTTIGRELFDGRSPLGESLRIKDVSFKIIGVFKSKGANMMGQDQDDIILTPWTTVRYRISGSKGSSSVASTAQSSISTSAVYPSSGVDFYPEVDTTQSGDYLLNRRIDYVDTIMVSVIDGKYVNKAIKDVTALLRSRHNLPPDKEDDFTIRNFSEMANMLTSTTKVMTNLLLCVALISLLVGGVGIMNIMLVSVTERTREIGLRMAVGAKAADIWWQFLVEAMVLCTIGGVIGMLLGIGASSLIAMLLGWPVEISVTSIVTSVAVSLAVGLVFGFYPAWKASRLDPIDALRYE